MKRSGNEDLIQGKADTSVEQVQLIFFKSMFSHQFVLKKCIKGCEISLKRQEEEQQWLFNWL